MPSSSSSFRRSGSYGSSGSAAASPTETLTHDRAADVSPPGAAAPISTPTSTSTSTPTRDRGRSADIRLQTLRGGVRAPTPTPASGEPGANHADPEADRRPLFNALPKDWEGFRSQITAARTRFIDTAEIATIINEVRHTGAHAIREGKLATSAEALLAQVDKHYLDRWRLALGMAPEDLGAQQRAQRSANHLLLIARLAPSALQYGVVPTVGLVTHDPMKTLYASVVLSIANLVINAVMQPITTGTSEFIQARGGPSVKLDEKSVNFKHRMPIESDKTRAAAKALEDAKQALRTCVDTLLGQDVALDAPDMHARLAALAPHDRERALGAFRRVAEAGQAAQTQARTLMMTVSTLLRQRVANQSQGALKISRPPFAAVASLLGHGAHRANLLNSREVLLVSVGIVLASLLVQFLLLAPKDQQRKVDAKHRLNALFADVVKPASRARMAAGEVLGPQDMDEEKLRKLVVSPAEAMLERAIKETEKALNRYPPQRREAIAKMIEEWKADRVGWLARSGDGAGVAEISERALDVANRATGGGLWRAAITTKFNRREMTDEMVRSFCKSYQLGLFGAAGAQLVPRLVNGLSGGAANVPLPGYLGLLGASLLSSATGAFSEDMVVTLVNTRKKEDAAQQPPIWKDIGTGMAALVVKYLNQREANQALKSAHAALTDGAYLAALDVSAKHPQEPSIAHVPDAQASMTVVTDVRGLPDEGTSDRDREAATPASRDPMHGLANSLGMVDPDDAFFAGLHAAVFGIEGADEQSEQSKESEESEEIKDGGKKMPG
ncbi:hypothetical protein [Pandoraea anhela]|uniref:Type III effector protein n=1 Tax=Pandoraea anhela TaxID=2508295 RepID=A0A5E4WMJ7_9BURK|nr:hypothetical protein [Pandoraea anhela]VVE25363.1 hypothetical protein PAN31108_03348 [Pandoraea anhela]